MCAEIHIPLHEQSSLTLVYAFIQMCYADMRGYRNTTFLDGCLLLLLTEMNFLVHLQEVGVTSQNLTLKQHQTHWFCLQGRLTMSPCRRNNDKTEDFFSKQHPNFFKLFFLQDLHALKSNPFAIYKFCCVLQGKKKQKRIKSLLASCAHLSCFFCCH